LSKLKGLEGDGLAVPVVHSSNGKLIGVVTEHDLAVISQEISEDLRREENAPL